MTDDHPRFDLAELLAALDRHHLRYVVIGGVAALVHGNQRATFDLDITPHLDRANLERLAAALTELGAHLRGVGDLVHDLDPTEPDHLALGGNWTLTTSAGSLHVLGDPMGAAPYGELEGRAVTVEL